MSLSFTMQGKCFVYCSVHEFLKITTVSLYYYILHCLAFIATTRPFPTLFARGNGLATGGPGVKCPLCHRVAERNVKKEARGGDAKITIGPRSHPSPSLVGLVKSPSIDAAPSMPGAMLCPKLEVMEIMECLISGIPDPYLEANEHVYVIC